MGKELKSLNRSELIEIIYQLKKSEQELQKENEALRKSLESKRIALSNAGSIAEASLALTDIFTAAQTAADMYLAEIERRRAEAQREYNLIIDDANNKANEIVKNASAQWETINADTQRISEMLKQYESAIKKKSTDN